MIQLLAHPKMIAFQQKKSQACNPTFELYMHNHAIITVISAHQLQD